MDTDYYLYRVWSTGERNMGRTGPASAIIHMAVVAGDLTSDERLELRDETDRVIAAVAADGHLQVF